MKTPAAGELWLTGFGGLDSAGPVEIVFENQEHDFPNRIMYRREGDLMTSRIEGVLSGELTSRQWEWRLED